MECKSINNFDSKKFLKNYWQKKPLKIKGAFPHFKSPLSPDELAGLSMEGISESRIIYQKNNKFKLLQGPFKKNTFSNLPGKWTLLVQEVDKYVPEVHEMLQSFRFIPSWRIDDIMISYAIKGGGVGPHIDNYDVFLIQGLGKRKWRWSSKKVTSEELVEDSEVRLLKNAEFDREDVFEPGDVLYLPPKVAHDGISLSDDCMTYSVGFRAPTSKDLIQNFLAKIITEIPENEFYEDPGLTKQILQSQIQEKSMKELLHLVKSKMTDELLKEVVGSFVSNAGCVQPEPHEEVLDKKEWLKKFETERVMVKSEAANMYFYESISTKEIWCFVNGTTEKYPLKLKKFFQEIFENGRAVFNSKILDYKDLRSFLFNHYAQGNFYFLSED